MRNCFPFGEKACAVTLRKNNACAVTLWKAHVELLVGELSTLMRLEELSAVSAAHHKFSFSRGFKGDGF